MITIAATTALIGIWHDLLRKAPLVLQAILLLSTQIARTWTLSFLGPGK